MTEQNVPKPGSGRARAGAWRRAGSWAIGGLAAALVVPLAWQTAAWQTMTVHAQGRNRYVGPTSSQPLALTADGAFLAVANPDNDTVTFFQVGGDFNRRLAELPVQKEPNGVAFLPDGGKLYVANTVAGTVTIFRTDLSRGFISQPRHLRVGTEPYALAVTPNGRRLYVANARSNDITVIDTATDSILTTITEIGFEPRGLAITNDGDGDDEDETLYATQFLALPVAGKLDGADDGKSAHVTVIATRNNTVVADAEIQPIADTGFLANGDALKKIAPAGDFRFKTGAYPNQLNSAAIVGKYLLLPNTAASPNGPVRFDVNTQSLINVLDRETNKDAGQVVNLHRAVADQSGTPRRFASVPWAIAAKNQANEAYVVSAASNVVMKVLVDGTTGALTVAKDPTDSGRVLQIAAGRNPRGIVVNASDTRAYVMNFISRDVTVVNLNGPKESVLTTLRSAALPAAGSDEEKVHIGKELYHTSIGEFDPVTPEGAPITGRMSANGWGSCSTCHPFGLSDNVVWIFGAGPRRTIPQHTDFDQTDPTRKRQRALNWSAIFDEEEDFEANIRGTSGGQGLLVQRDNVTQDPALAAFTPASGGRNQLKVRGVGAWDAIKMYEQFGIRAPISPVSKSEPDVIEGEKLFRAANCQSCHGGAQWTSAAVRFTPPPAASLITRAQIFDQLQKVGTFDPAFPTEVRANATAPLGADGFAPASLLSLFAFPKTFLHHGALTSLDDVMKNVTHRAAGTGGIDMLTKEADRAKLIRFLESIDANTPPIPQTPISSAVTTP